MYSCYARAHQAVLATVWKIFTKILEIYLWIYLWKILLQGFSYFSLHETIFDYVLIGIISWNKPPGCSVSSPLTTCTSSTFVPAASCSWAYHSLNVLLNLSLNGLLTLRLSCWNRSVQLFGTCTWRTLFFSRKVCTLESAHCHTCDLWRHRRLRGELGQE